MKFGDSSRVFKMVTIFRPDAVLSLPKWLEDTDISISYISLGGPDYMVHIVRRAESRMLSRVSIPVKLDAPANISSLLLAIKSQYEDFFPQVKKLSSNA